MLKKITIILFILLLSCVSNNKYPWFLESFDIAKSVAGSRLIMLDFYADWWGGCIRLDADTFTDSQIIKNADKYISLKIDVDIPENKILSEKFNVSSIPQNIFVNANGNEVDRIIGYLPPEEYKIKVLNILNGEGTVSDLKNKLSNNPNDVELLYTLGEKLEQMGEYSEAAINYHNILKINSDIRFSELANFNLVKIKLIDGNTEPLITYLNENPDSENLSSGFKLLTRHFRKEENIAIAGGNIFIP